MSPAGKINYAADEIPLILCAALRHPDGTVRTRLRQIIEEWIHSAEPRYSREQIASLLRSQSGTAIEPFVLDDEDLELAVMLIQYAFSKAGSQTRFRVVSRETIGTDGGVMLTNNLRGYYIERYARGFRTKNGRRFGFVAPAELPAPEDLQSRQQTPSAVCRFEDTGLSITVSEVDLAEGTGLTPFARLNLLQHSGHVLSPHIPFTQLGLRVTAEGGAVRIQTGSPESLLRVSAHMMQRSVLVVALDDQTGPQIRAFIRLEPPGEDVLVLPVAVTCTSRSLPEWMWLPDAARIPLTLEDRLAIAQWFRPHDSWMDTTFLEEIV